MNELNNSSPIFNCRDCKLAFPSENQYKVHRALSHNERCKYECVCGKDYMFKKDLKRHQRKCTAQESYRCRKCECIFSDLHNGRMHEAVCQPMVDRQSSRIMLEPTRNELLALKTNDDNITPYETAFDGRLASYFIRSPCCRDLPQFLNNIKSKVFEIIKKHVNQVFSIKVNLWVDCTFKNMQGEEMSKALKTSNKPIYKGTDIDEYLFQAFCKLKREMEEAAMSKSGWKLISVDGLRVRIGKYNPLKISSYIPLPKNIENKKACINVKNLDNKCFMYSILAKFVNKNAHLPHHYEKRSLKNKYNFACVQYPTELKHISIFEKINNITINIFSLDEHNRVYPLRIVKKKCRDHRNLLLLGDKKRYHYVYIKNFKKLIYKQVGAHKRSKLICDRCFTQFDRRYNGEIRFKRHEQICGTKTPAKIELPFKKPFAKFECIERMHRVPIVVYLDFETILEKVVTEQPSVVADQSYTLTTHKHIPMSFCLYVKASNELDNIVHDLPKEPYLYRGADAGKHCIIKLKEIAEKVAVLYSLNTECSLSEAEMVYHSEASLCYMCNSPFLNAKHFRKVIDHSHLSGKYRGPAHNSCNLRCKLPNFLPVFCHNLSGYDAHIIVKELGYDNKDIEVIPNSEEKYISFSKIINNKIKLRFLDSYRFMASSLDSLTKNLTHLPDTSKFIPQNLMHLIKRKGVFPYEYVSNWEKLNETFYPPIEAFFSSLTGETINEEDYLYGRQVWEAFSCKTLGEYSDIYLKIDVMLLTDIFENFRNVTINSHKLDPAHYYTLPGLSWDAMLKFTKCELELLFDYDQILMVERGIRGGICQVSHRFVEANNKYMSEYNPSLESTYITYQDCNNLYGFAMNQYLPYGGFKWANPEEINLESVNETSEIGYILDVNVDYPSSLHDLHNDLPFLAENILVDGQMKLVPHLGPRVNYVCHYMILKQALQHGLKLTKINRVLEFKQSPWLSSYIQHNTELRTKTNNEFEKDLYKLYNNSVFGKTMENVRNKVDIKLVSDAQKLEKLIAQHNCINWTIYSETLAAIHFARTKILYNKPIYVGLTVLDLSKIQMYYYHYDIMTPLYKNNLKLCYTDTDSFVYEIKTVDLYQDMYHMRNHLDLSNYPPNHKYYSEENKKKLGKFKDEAAGKIISAFVGLRPKMYAIKIGDEDYEKKAKGVKKNIIKKNITFEDYVACLISNLPMKHKMYMFRSVKHQLLTIEQNKTSLCPLDNKRYILEDGISTRALNHFRNLE